MNTVSWHLDILALLLCGILCAAFYYTGAHRGKKVMCFYTAIILLLIMECSPLHQLGMQTYFSAHMIIHVLLLLICGPLLVMSVPDKHFLKFTVFLSGYSWLAWLTGVGLMWFWHIPAIFDAAMPHGNSSFALLPAVQLISILLAGVIFAWPVIGPNPRLRLHPLTGIIYLGTACVSCSLLGLLITFAPAGTYHHYLVTGAINNPWQLTAAADQQAAGLIMWVPCCFIYIGGSLFLLQLWFREKETPPGGHKEELLMATEK